MLLGINEAAEIGSFARSPLVAPQGLAQDFALHFGELIFDLAAAVTESGNERRIESVERCAELPHRPYRGSLRLRHRVRNRARNQRGGDPFPQIFFAVEEILD